MCVSPEPKHIAETPPPSYEEALKRQSVRLPEIEQQASTSAEQADVVGRQVNENATENVVEVTRDIAFNTKRVSDTTSETANETISEDVNL